MQKLISCGGFRYNSNDFIEENGELKLKNSGGGNVLVAHAMVAYEDFAAIDPENPLVITIDKTYAELAAVDDSMISVDLMAEGVALATLRFRNSWGVNTGSPLIVYGLPEHIADFALDGQPYYLGIGASSEGVMIIAFPASSGGGTLIAHATSESYPTAGGEPVTLTVNENYSDLEAAGYSVMEYNYNDSIIYLPLLTNNQTGLCYGATIMGNSLTAVVTFNGATISLSS